MKTFLKYLFFTSFGIFISFAMTFLLPQTIKSVTAQLSTTTVLPLQDMSTLMNKFPKSLKQKTTPVPFALPRIELRNNNQAVQLDMNGDGLLDIIYSYSYNNNSGFQYVLLNNGSGFEAAYLCSQTYTNKPYPLQSQIDQIFYQGDCADYN